MWEQKRVIQAEYHEGGELMLSASDVVAFLRHHGSTIRPAFLGRGVHAVADELVSLLLDATSPLVDHEEGDDS